MQDLNDKITGNTLTAAEWNEVPSEIQNVIEGLGITLSGGDLNQLGKAIAGYSANGSFYTDSGAADAYVLSVIGSKQALPGYTDGMEIVWLADNANTGSSTVNVAGLGAKDIKALGGNIPAAGDVSSTAINYARYDLANGWFVLQDSPDSLIAAITITPPTDADVTLTNAQTTRDRLVLVDGSWTVGRNIIVPDESRRFYVDNTAGSFGATVKTSAGTGITIAAGSAALLTCDTVNVLNSVTLGLEQATETASGVVELATQSEVDAGTDAERVITPATLKASTLIGGWALIESWDPTAVATKDFVWDEALYSQIMIVGRHLQVTSDGNISLHFGYDNGGTFYSTDSLPSATSSNNTARATAFECTLIAPADNTGSITNPAATDASKTLRNSANVPEHATLRDLLIPVSDFTTTDSAQLSCAAGTFRAGVGVVLIYGMKRD